jgi:uncharacterized membrane protein YbhN (UPF0104 family)
MIAPDQALSESTLRSLDVRGLARRAAVPGGLAAGAAAAAILAGGRITAVADALRRVLDVSPGWALIGLGFEFISLAGYVGLLALVAGCATSRVGMRESAQITLAGAAATRLLPTAGAGGAALTVWTLRRAGLRPRAAIRTLLVFFVLLYSVFLASIVFCGVALSFAVVDNHGPKALSAAAAAVALSGIALALGFAFRPGLPSTDEVVVGRRFARMRAASRVIGLAVRDALRLVRSGDPRLAGAAAYWVFDAAVLWAMLHAFGSPPAAPIVALAYLLGQVANTVPLPGTVSGGMAAVLIAFGAPAALTVPAVLAYRTVAVWLPLPPAIAAIPRLRTTVAAWAPADTSAPAQIRELTRPIPQPPNPLTRHMTLPSEEPHPGQPFPLAVASRERRHSPTP